MENMKPLSAYEEDESLIIPKEKRVLKLQSYDKAVEDIIGMIKKGKLVLSEVEFQREYVWDDKIASLFIESIILNVPVPPVYVAEEQDGKWLVIDGLQRLTSLKRFYADSFPLVSLEVLNELEGQIYSNLNSKAQEILNDGNIRITVITKDSNPDIKFDVFMRLNRGSVKLTEQELRNCMYRGSLNTLLKELAKNDLFAGFKRYEAEELILRYFAISDAYNKETKMLTSYSGSMKNFLSEFMHAKRDINSGELKKLRDKFLTAMDNSKRIFGENVFKAVNDDGINYAPSIYKSVFDFVMIGFEDKEQKKLFANKEEIEALLKTIFIKNEDNEIFRDAVYIRAASKTKIETRLKIWLSKLRDIL